MILFKSVLIADRATESCRLLNMGKGKTRCQTWHNVARGINGDLKVIQK